MGYMAHAARTAARVRRADATSHGMGGKGREVQGIQRRPQGSEHREHCTAHPMHDPGRSTQQPIRPSERASARMWME